MRVPNHPPHGFKPVTMISTAQQHLAAGLQVISHCSVHPASHQHVVIWKLLRLMVMSSWIITGVAPKLAANVVRRAAVLPSPCPKASMSKLN